MLLLRTEAFFSSQAEEVVPPSILGTPSIQHFTSGVDPQNVDYTLVATATGLALCITCDSNEQTISGVTWTATGASGQSMTQVTNAFAAQSGTRAWIYYLHSPNFGTAAGVGVISIDFTGNMQVSVVPLSLTGWAGAAPIGANQAGLNVTDPDPLSIDPDANSLIIHSVVSANTAPTMTFGTGGDETELFDENGGNSARHGFAHKSSVSGDATTVNVVFSEGPARFAEVAAAFRAAA